MQRGMVKVVVWMAIMISGTIVQILFHVVYNMEVGQTNSDGISQLKVGGIMASGLLTLHILGIIVIIGTGSLIIIIVVRGFIIYGIYGLEISSYMISTKMDTVIMPQYVITVVGGVPFIRLNIHIITLGNH